MTGKNDPFRSLGIRSSTSPAWVASNRSRAPLRSVVRDPVRSYLAAPIRSVASASIRSCMTIRTDSRTRSTPSPVRNASSSSDTADWDKAIGGFPSVSAWPYTPKISPMAAYFTPPRRTSNPTTPRDAYNGNLSTAPTDAGSGSSDEAGTPEPAEKALSLQVVVRDLWPEASAAVLSRKCLDGTCSHLKCTDCEWLDREWIDRERIDRERIDRRSSSASIVSPSTASA